MFDCTSGTADGFRDTRMRGLAGGCVFLFLLALSACGAVRQPAPQPIRSDFVILIERGEDVPPGRIFMKPVSGGLQGRAKDTELYRSATVAEQIEISLAGITGEIADHVAVTRNDDANPGELAIPRNLQIARVATFYSPDFRDRRCNNFRTGLRADWPAQAMLVYVDRPGSMQGTRYASPYIMEYDLEFPEAGLYAVALQVHGIHVTQRVMDGSQALVARVRRSECKEHDSLQAAR